VDIPLWETAGIIASIVFSAFFSASETALTSLTDFKTRQLMETRGRLARPLWVWLEHPNQVLTTILIGNNLSNITASILASSIANHYFDDQAIPYTIGVMTFVLLVVSEITPKTFARAFPETSSLVLVHFIYLFFLIFFPISWGVAKFTRALIRLTGKKHEGPTVTEEDLSYLVRMGYQSGVLDKNQSDLLHSVIDFSDTIAREIMTPRTTMLALPEDSSYEEVVKAFQETRFSRIPVYRENRDQIVGVIYSKYLIPPPSRKEQKTFLSARMRKPVYIPETMKIQDLIQLFQAERIHLGIVVNEFGGTEGLVTLEDVVEELFGEIRDEFDQEEMDLLSRKKDGSMLANARVGVEALEDELKIRFPLERQYDTLGGFLMETAGMVPEVGWKHAYEGYLFQVEEADQTKVILVSLRKQQQEDSSSRKAASARKKPVEKKNRQRKYGQRNVESSAP